MAKNEKRIKGEMNAEDTFLHAVGAYVESIGGKAVVVGGIQVEYWSAKDLNFRVSVKCTGKIPTRNSDHD